MESKFMCVFQLHTRRYLQDILVLLHLTGECHFRGCPDSFWSLHSKVSLCYRLIIFEIVHKSPSPQVLQLVAHWYNLRVYSLCGRYDRAMQSVRTTPCSHIWWSFVWVSWRLQLLAGWGLQPSLLYTSGWDMLRQFNKEKKIDLNLNGVRWSSCAVQGVEHGLDTLICILNSICTTYISIKIACLCVLTFIFMQTQSEFFSVWRCFDLIWLKKKNVLWICRWVCQWQKNRSDSVSGRCIWVASYSWWTAHARRKKVEE